MEQEENVGEFINIDDETLKIRIQAIQDLLESTAVILRKNIPEDEQDLNNEYFINWTLTNLILNISRQDKLCVGINRLLYFLFEHCQRNVMNLLAQFSLNVDFEEKDGQKIPKFTLVINEEEKI